eukprot:CAMPEP_0117660104 /NCGR_PEP_ID=MMETSP0804-20121206/6788_1 /TAXON_ID=1074897 /ORGANISM="Tetraselmis astigmatica, Strain CCMP880" /LENGTH=173 /DNA_ID=CAMNT_0005466807 /DNA_START=316 /DNA_END=837 /DNA_ORIENTATION=+
MWKERQAYSRHGAALKLSVLVRLLLRSSATGAVGDRDGVDLGLDHLLQKCDAVGVACEGEHPLRCARQELPAVGDADAHAGGLLELGQRPAALPHDDADVLIRYTPYLVNHPGHHWLPLRQHSSPPVGVLMASVGQVGWVAAAHRPPRHEGLPGVCGDAAKGDGMAVGGGHTG